MQFYLRLRIKSIIYSLAFETLGMSTESIYSLNTSKLYIIIFVCFG